MRCYWKGIPVKTQDCGTVKPVEFTTFCMHVGLILGLAEQEKVLRKIVKNNNLYKTTSVQTASWEKREETNDQGHSLGSGLRK